MATIVSNDDAKLARYIVSPGDARIGAGAFSEVLLARDSVTGERVALKRVFSAGTASRSSRGT